VSELKKFKSHKVVWARPMTSGQYLNFHSGHVTHPPLGGMAKPGISEVEMDGYLVVYGKRTKQEYWSWSPKKQFEEGNSIIEGLGDRTGIIRYFAYEHLPDLLQAISRPLCDLAIQMDDLPDGPEKEAGLRKLLEAKDCFVRASL